MIASDCTGGDETDEKLEGLELKNYTALLEYKNANCADFDPMDEFTLEW